MLLFTDSKPHQVIFQIRRTYTIKFVHPATLAADIVVQCLKVISLIFNSFFITVYQLIMNNPCICYLDIALISIRAQYRTPTDQRLQGRRDLRITFIQ